MQKYRKYIGLKHSWEAINCLTLIENIYKDFLSIDFSNMWKRAGRYDGVTKIDKNWHRQYGAPTLLNELQHWIKVPLLNVQEYDILVFTSRQNIPFHFAMYIGDNLIIHITEGNYSTIAELDETRRKNLELEGTSSGIYRERSQMIIQEYYLDKNQIKVRNELKSLSLDGLSAFNRMYKLYYDTGGPVTAGLPNLPAGEPGKIKYIFSLLNIDGDIEQDFLVTLKKS